MGFGVGQIIGDYKLVRCIGEGSTSSVWLAQHTVINIQVAIKIINKFSENVLVDNIKKEINIMKRLHHPNIVKFFEVIENASFIYIVMEYLTGGTLAEELSVSKKITEAKSRKYITQIMVTLIYLHQCNIMHRDIKAENIMLDSNSNIKLLDFGLSKDSNFGETSVGSPAYAAPEIILKHQYNESVDTWSVGILLYHMITGIFPFFDPNIPRLLTKIVTTELRATDDISVELFDLLQVLLEKNPKNRISLQQAIEHPWISTHLTVPSIYVNEDFTVDTDVLNKVGDYGIEITNLEEKLKNKVDDRETTIYKMLVYNKARESARNRNTPLTKAPLISSLFVVRKNTSIKKMNTCRMIMQQKTINMNSKNRCMIGFKC